MKATAYTIFVFGITVHTAMAADLNMSIPRPPINVSTETQSFSSASFSSQQTYDPLSRNMRDLMNDACTSCTSPERKKEMVLEVNSRGLRDLLPLAVKGPSFHWQGNKTGFTEHNLRMRLSRNRVGLNWESRFN